ncbi:MAG: cyclic nucleotide-binding domain-containing protein [Cryobacterium sp.]|nr:cyclic nucleotide-binding domain-containing protein [Oligoflexia bacterium]
MMKGDILFKEGDVSNAMYLIRSGSIRIFKRKGDSQIEIDILRSGQILGEMAFLDGNARSASAEAMADTELVEISKSVFDSTMVKVPEWVKILLKAVVARLRSTTTKVKNLETASGDMNYSEGKRNFSFISSHDALKIGTASLLVASLKSNASGEREAVRISGIEKYANQVMGVPLAKVSGFIDILIEVGVFQKTNDEKKLAPKDVELLELFLQHVCDENLLDPTKRHDLNLRGFAVMNYVAKHVGEFPKDAESGRAEVNVAAIKKVESEAAGREVFRMEEFDELVKIGYGTAIKVISTELQTSSIHVEPFQRAHRVQQILKLIETMNDDKQKAALGYRPIQ